MNVRNVDEKTSIIEMLNAADEGGIIAKRADGNEYAILPLDDDLIDYLLERSPKLIAHCEAIRQEMRAGKYLTLEEVQKMFARANLRGSS